LPKGATLRGKNVVVVEDVTTTGGSSMQAIEALREEGANIVLVLTIVDRLEGAQENFAISAIAERVRRHLSGELQDFSDVRYDFANVPPFNLAVLRATLAIRAGVTASYGEIAQAIGHTPGVSRAVGLALGANRWPLLIPCHRVVSATGKMTGFSGPGGVRTKTRLLALEGAQLLSE
jgi:methylated-DNA-[protein]-cysteine S-methyltransferase